MLVVQNTVNSQIFVRILFSWIALKDLLDCYVQILNKGIIYIYQYKTIEWFRQFMRIIFWQNLAFAKFRENKTLAKISEFTVEFYLLHNYALKASKYTDVITCIGYIQHRLVNMLDSSRKIPLPTTQTPLPNYKEATIDIILFAIHIHPDQGAVVECLTGDRGAVGLSLTGITVLWSLSKTHLSYHRTG